MAMRGLLHVSMVLFSILACTGAIACKRPLGLTSRRDGGADAGWCARNGPSPAVSKRQMADALLQGSPIYVHLDSRREDVVVPEEHKGKNQLVLQIGYDLPNPIPDLEISGDGFSGTLSFHHEPFLCRVPWSAVYGLVDEHGKGGIWYTSVPQDLRCAE
jgi:hypothetical protein